MHRKYHKKIFWEKHETKTGLNGYVYDLNIGYEAIAVGYILDTDKYLMKKEWIVWKCSDLWSKYLFQQ